MIAPIERLWDRPIHVFHDNSGKYFNVGNGCIQRTDTGYVLLNRIQNHFTSLGRHHPSMKEKVQTVSFAMWIDLDMECNPVHTHIIDQSLVYQKSTRQVNRQLIAGIEDTRLMPKQYDAWAFVTSTGHFERWNQKEFWGQALGVLSDDTTKIRSIDRLSYASRRIMEKNWLPFWYQEDIHILYQSDPIIILHPDFDGFCEVVHRGPKLNLPIFRGSGPPIEWGDKYLYTVHEQGIERGELGFLDDKYYYFHRFVEFDKDFNLTRMSPLFTFREEGVEYTCGHCLSHDGTQLLIPYSSSGGTDSNLIAVSVETVESMLDA
jgi:hypothetical protein